MLSQITIYIVKYYDTYFIELLIDQCLFWQGENDNKPRMAWNAHAQLYTINS